MPYVRNPITYPSGKVSEDTAKINTNFSILADAFYNSDPENSPIYRACYVGITAPLNPKVGQIWVDTSVAPPVIKVYNGTSWLEVKPASVDEPTSPYVGQFWLDTTVSPPVLKIYDGANWQVVNSPYKGNTAPTSPYVGQIWLDTSVNPPVLKIYDGANWQSNADLLDGQEGSYYLNRANHTGTQPPNTISPQGHGSGLDADMLDGFHASQTPAPNVIVPLDASGILDLSATYVKSSVYTFRRVDLTNATSDYELQVGEEAYISFDNQQLVPFRISIPEPTSATTPVVYNIVIGIYWASGINMDFDLFPNNTTYANQINYITFLNSDSGWIKRSAIVDRFWFDTYEGADNFPWFANLFVVYYGIQKPKFLYGSAYSVNSIAITSQIWNNTTTAWTSLGSFRIFPGSVLNISGMTLVRRLA